MSEQSASDHYKALFERELNRANASEAYLFRAWTVIRAQSKGLQRQRRIINRLRTQLNEQGR